MNCKHIPSASALLVALCSAMWMGSAAVSVAAEPSGAGAPDGARDLIVAVWNSDGSPALGLSGLLRARAL